MLFPTYELFWIVSSERLRPEKSWQKHGGIGTIPPKPNWTFILAIKIAFLVWSHVSGLGIEPIIIWIIQFLSLQCGNNVKFRKKSPKTDWINWFLKLIKTDSSLFWRACVKNWRAKLVEVESYKGYFLKKFKFKILILKTCNSCLFSVFHKKTASYREMPYLGQFGNLILPKFFFATQTEKS